MTTTLAFRFPQGRFHTAPWGLYTNDDAVELPTSPWRLLRVLYAVWRERVPGLPAQAVGEVFDALAVPLVIFVPSYRVARGGGLDVCAVFDPGSELAMQWPGVTLSPEQYAVLRRLAESVLYLGRADNLCDVRVTAEWWPTAHDRWMPVREADYIPDNVETMRLVVPQRPLLQEVLEPGLAEPTGPVLPVGSELVAYQRVPTSIPVRSGKDVPVRRVQAVRFDIAEDARPPRADALAYTDLLRSAALSQLGKLRPERKGSVLGGKTAQSQKATANHGHAHYLPLFDEDRLSSLVVWVPDGLPDDELAALLGVRTLRSGRNKRWCADVQVTATGGLARVAPDLCGSSRTWDSMTPFAPSMRHFKKSWDLHQIMQRGIKRELRYRGMEDVDVEVEVRGSERTFRQNRLTKQGWGKPTAVLRLHMDRPASGPLALGHLSHFGLGLFAPCRE